MFSRDAGYCGNNGNPGTAGTAGAPGAAGTVGTAGTIGTPGTAGTAGVCPACAPGTPGTAGTMGSPGGLLGAAEYVRTDNVNDSVEAGTPFFIDTLVYNSVPANIVAGPGVPTGTAFTLSTGTYIVDYEMSLAPAMSVAIYRGPTAGSLAADTNTIAGSSTATTWIHGRAIIQVITATEVIAISPFVTSPAAAVVTAGNAAGYYMIRLTILQIA